MKRHPTKQARAKVLRAKFIDDDTIQLNITDLVNGDVTVFTFNARTLATARTLRDVLETTTVETVDPSQDESEEGE